MTHGTWYTTHGTWYTTHGTWYMIHMGHGSWYMGQWDMVHGTCYMLHGTWVMIPLSHVPYNRSHVPCRMSHFAPRPISHCSMSHCPSGSLVREGWPILCLCSPHPPIHVNITLFVDLPCTAPHEIRNGLHLYGTNCICTFTNAGVSFSVEPASEIRTTSIQRTTKMHQLVLLSVN